MNPLFKFAVILVAVIIFPRYNALAEEDSVFLAGIRITIGMPKTYVISEIGKHYRLSKEERERESDEMWVVFPKDEKSNPIGFVMFKEGKVFWVGKSWGSYGNNQAIEAAKTLFHLLSKLRDEGKKVAFINTSSLREPGWSSETIEFTLGGKRVLLSIYEGKHGSSVSIQENLEK
jgi:hypothetical protein